jgi:hypothetical protein
VDLYGKAAYCTRLAGGTLLERLMSLLNAVQLNSKITLACKSLPGKSRLENRAFPKRTPAFVLLFAAFRGIDSGGRRPAVAPVEHGLVRSSANASGFTLAYAESKLWAWLR